MEINRIKDVIRRCFDQAAGLAEPAILAEVTETSYVPGFAPSKTSTNWPVRMIYGKALGGLGRIEDGPVLNEAAVNVGWLYSPDITPSVDDEIRQGGESVLITKVAPLDHGANVLFEVWYQ